MREIKAEDVVTAVAGLCIEANYILEPDVVQAMKEARSKEASEVGRGVYDTLLENLRVAGDRVYPICQDTGLAVVFIGLGQDAHVVGGGLEDAINEGVRRGYAQGYLRKSVVGHPLKRVNTQDNTPAIIHYTVVPGDTLEVTVAPKGAGSENMSRLAMLKPSEGIEGVRRFVLRTVEDAGPNPCPPIVVGVGIGGNLEKCAILAKSALIRPIGLANPDPDMRDLESDLLKAINALGIGPQGFGGTTTALAVHVETYPTHIASLPVAVNINCHVARHKSVTL